VRLLQQTLPLLLLSNFLVHLHEACPADKAACRNWVSALSLRSRGLTWRALALQARFNRQLAYALVQVGEELLVVLGFGHR
jgi:hypothetical protein